METGNKQNTCHLSARSLIRTQAAVTKKSRAALHLNGQQAPKFLCHFGFPSTRPSRFEVFAARGIRCSNETSSNHRSAQIETAFCQKLGRRRMVQSKIGRHPSIESPSVKSPRVFFFGLPFKLLILAERAPYPIATPQHPLDMGNDLYKETYGSILGWMNIHLQPIFMFTRVQGFDPQPQLHTLFQVAVEPTIPALGSAT